MNFVALFDEQFCIFERRFQFIGILSFNVFSVELFCWCLNLNRIFKTFKALSTPACNVCLSVSCLDRLNAHLLVLFVACDEFVCGPQKRLP